MQNKNIKNKKEGFTLVETLVSISIFSVSLLGIMSVLASGISNTGYAKRKMTATYLAQEGIEYVRNMRDTYVLYNSNFLQFRNALNPCENSNCGINDTLDVNDNSFIFLCGDCKLYIDSDGHYGKSGSTDSGFTRTIRMKKVGSGQDEVRILSTVSWTQGSGPFSITFSENLYNWIE